MCASRGSTAVEPFIHEPSEVLVEHIVEQDKVPVFVKYLLSRREKIMNRLQIKIMSGGKW